MTRLELQWDGRRIGAIALARFGRARIGDLLAGIFEGEFQADGGFEVCRDVFKEATRLYDQFDLLGLAAGDVHHPAGKAWEDRLESMRPHIEFPELGQPVHSFWFENGRVEVSFGEFPQNDRAQLGEVWFSEAAVGGWVPPGYPPTPTFWEFVAPLRGCR